MMPQDGFAAKAAFRRASGPSVELWERRCAARRGNAEASWGRLAQRFRTAGAPPP